MALLSLLLAVASSVPSFAAGLGGDGTESRNATPSLRTRRRRGAVVEEIEEVEDLIATEEEMLTLWVPSPRSCPGATSTEPNRRTFYDCNNPRCTLHKPCAALNNRALEKCFCPPYINKVLRTASRDRYWFVRNPMPLDAGHHVHSNTAPSCSVPRPSFNPEFLCAMGYSWNVGVSLQALWSMLGAHPLEGGCTVHNTLVVDMSPEQHMKRFLSDGVRDMGAIDGAHAFPEAGKHYLEYFQHKSPWDCINVHVPRASVPMPFTMFQNIVQSFAREGRYRWHFWQHMDATILPAAPEEDGTVLDPYEVLAAYTSYYLDQHPMTGIIYFDYDHVAAFSAELDDTVHWDNYAPQYGSDCDFYSSVEKVLHINNDGGVIAELSSIFHGDVVFYDQNPKAMMAGLKSALNDLNAGIFSTKRQELKDSFKDEIILTKQRSFPHAGHEFLAIKWNADGEKGPLSCQAFFDRIPAPGFYNGPPSQKFFALHEVFTNAHQTFAREKKEARGVTFARCPKGSRLAPAIQRVRGKMKNGKPDDFPEMQYSNWFFGAPPSPLSCTLPLSSLPLASSVLRQYQIRFLPPALTAPERCPACAHAHSSRLSPSPLALAIGDIHGRKWSDDEKFGSHGYGNFVCMNYGVPAHKEAIIGIALGDESKQPDECPPCFWETKRFEASKIPKKALIRYHKSLCLARRRDGCTPKQLKFAQRAHGAVLSEHGFIDIAVALEDVGLREELENTPYSFRCPEKAVKVCVLNFVSRSSLQNFNSFASFLLGSSTLMWVKSQRISAAALKTCVLLCPSHRLVRGAYGTDRPRTPFTFAPRSATPPGRVVQRSRLDKLLLLNNIIASLSEKARANERYA